MRLFSNSIGRGLGLVVFIATVSVLAILGNVSGNGISSLNASPMASPQIAENPAGDGAGQPGYVKAVNVIATKKSLLAPAYVQPPVDPGQQVGGNTMFSNAYGNWVQSQGTPSP
jgi:hypothetical protein